MDKFGHTVGKEPGKLVVPPVIEALHFGDQRVLHAPRLHIPFQRGSVYKKLGERVGNLNGRIPDGDGRLLFFFWSCRMQNKPRTRRSSRNFSFSKVGMICETQSDFADYISPGMS